MPIADDFKDLSESAPEANSDVAVSEEAIAAVLPPGMTLQEVAVRLAGGVCQAYAGYNNGSNFTPVLPGYKNINIINAYEIDPNGFPSWTAKAKAESAADARALSMIEQKPAAYAAPEDCTGPLPPGTPSMGYQLFGFTATADDLSHNILVFRGTVTMEEAAYDLFGWGNNTDCWLPSQWWEGKTNYGSVNSYLYGFYVDDTPPFGSLAYWTMQAVNATAASNPNVPWFVGGHSLGGAIASLAALDAAASAAFGSSPALVMTFGSLHVGDQSFATAYKPKVPYSFRIANLCDFVPSMVSLEPVTPTDPYVHVGAPGTFVWQTWDDWGNHSHANIYQPMVQSYWSIIQWGKRKYPQ